MLFLIGAVITAIVIHQERFILKLVEAQPELLTVAFSMLCLYWLAMQAIRISL